MGRVTLKSKNKLENLSIYELRDVARNIGVQSPSSKKKDVLISMIMDIVSGKSTPHEKKSNKGRPARPLMQKDDFYAFVMPTDFEDATLIHPTYIESENFERETLQGLSLAQDCDPYGEGETNDMDIISGQVDITVNGYGIARVEGWRSSHNDCYISAMLVHRYHLSSGDIIEAEVGQGKSGSARYVAVVDKINGIDAEGYKPSDNQLTHTCEVSANIVAGRPNYLVTSGSLDQIVADIAGQVTGKVYAIELDSILDTSMEEDGDITKYHLNYTEPIAGEIISTNLVLNRAKSCARCGQNCTLVLHSFTKYVTLIDRWNKGKFEYNSISNETLQEIKELLRSAGNYGNSSLTIVCVDDLSTSPTKQIVEMELSPIMNKISNK